MKLRVPVGLAIPVALAIGLWLPPTSALAASPNCVLSAHNRAVPAKELKPPITLSVENQSDPVLNFSGDRGTKFDYVTLKASPPLPPRIRPKNLELSSLVPMKRIGTDNLESTRLKFPNFTRPWIHSHGERITFAVCVNASGGDPGTYTGQVEVGGPVGLAPFQLTQTAQLKAPVVGLFGAFFLLALAAAGIFIWRKIGAENQAADANRKRGAQVLVAVLSLGAAAYAMWRIYDQTPDWGTDWVAGFAALVAAAFTAGGIGTTISSASGFITGNEAPKEKTESTDATKKEVNAPKKSTPRK